MGITFLYFTGIGINLKLTLSDKLCLGSPRTNMKKTKKKIIHTHAHKHTHTYSEKVTKEIKMLY